MPTVSGHRRASRRGMKRLIQARILGSDSRLSHRTCPNVSSCDASSAQSRCPQSVTSPQPLRGSRDFCPISSNDPVTCRLWLKAFPLPSFLPKRREDRCEHGCPSSSATRLTGADIESASESFPPRAHPARLFLRRARPEHHWPTGARPDGLSAFFAVRRARRLTYGFLFRCRPHHCPAANALPAVNVRGQADAPNFQPDVSSVDAKVPTALRDIPQAVVVPKSVLQSQAVSSFSDALRNVPGVTIGAAEGG